MAAGKEKRRPLDIYILIQMARRLLRPSLPTTSNQIRRFLTQARHFIEQFKELWVDAVLHVPLDHLIEKDYSEPGDFDQPLIFRGIDRAMGLLLLVAIRMVAVIQVVADQERPPAIATQEPSAIPTIQPTQTPSLQTWRRVPRPPNRSSCKLQEM